MEPTQPVPGSEIMRNLFAGCSLLSGAAIAALLTGLERDSFTRNRIRS